MPRRPRRVAVLDRLHTMLRGVMRHTPYTRWTATTAAHWERFTEWFNGRGFSENTVLLTFAVATGVLSALGVVGFYTGIDLAYKAFYRWPATYLPRISFLAYRPVVTAAGFLLAWWIMRRLGRGHEGMNVPDVQRAVVRNGGDIAARPAVARTLASAVTIGSGGSAGSEGPVVVFGAAIGSWLGRTFRFAPQRVVVLVGCATGAAISAAFNAPLAGAFFALEEVLGTLSGASFAPVVVASVMAAVVTRSVFGDHPAFAVPHEYGYAGLWEILIGYPLLGLVTGVIAAGFVRTYFATGSAATALMRRRRLPESTLPLVGGALVGVMVFLSRGMLVGYGHLAIHLDIFGHIAWYALLALGIGKIIATSLTLNTGGSGGVFTPSLYIGVATGGAVGVFLSHVAPRLGVHPEAFGLVGMGAMIAGATDAPITGILLVFEMTNDYALIVPLMLTVVICHAVARRLDPDSLYSGWLRRRGESIEHGTDRDVLAGLHVSDAYAAEPITIFEGTPIVHWFRHLEPTEQSYFPIVDETHCLMGIITLAELGRIMQNTGMLDGLLLAADIARPSESVALNDSLSEAIRKMGVRGTGALPVVDRRTGRLVGLLNRSHILDIYERSVRDPHH
ncbi:MAG TPA: chloride channel protein [Gemmatimonadaceae bacterium]|jgi:CIC family chloride channel protein|nr:chloride channel protein [Gemmatimonadaceae bacterium]